MKIVNIKESAPKKETVLVVNIATEEPSIIIKALRQILANDLQLEDRKGASYLLDRRAGSIGRIHFEWSSANVLKFFKLIPPEEEYELEYIEDVCSK